jgi:hypothetical protein
MRGRNNVTILKNRLTLGKGAGFFYGSRLDSEEGKGNAVTRETN